MVGDGYYKGPTDLFQLSYLCSPDADHHHASFHISRLSDFSLGFGSGFGFGFGFGLGFCKGPSPTPSQSTLLLIGDVSSHSTLQPSVQLY
jgi:hypothetical protein